MIAYLLDTNVILRFLRDDHAQHSPAARALFSDACNGIGRLLNFGAKSLEYKRIFNDKKPPGHPKIE